MSFFKKAVGTVGISLAAIFFLSACGSNKEASGEDGNGDVTIRFSWWGNDDRHKATLEAIKAFEEKNPGIKVKAEYSGWDGTIEKMVTQIAGGTEADLMQINYDWYTSYSPDGDGFYDLNKLDDIIDLSGYTESQLDIATINGKLNGIPHGGNASVLMLNKTKYDEFGVDISTLKTWDDYKEAAKKFPDGYYPLMFSNIGGTAFYLAQKYGVAMLDQEGNVNYSADQIAEGLEWYQEMVDAKVVPTQKQMIETVGTAHVATVKEFIDGKYDGVFDWTGGLASFQSILAENNMELTIADLPEIQDAKSTGVTKKPTMLFSISKNTKYSKESAKLLDFLLNDPDGVKLMGTSRGVPANSRAVDILEESGSIDEIAAAAYEYQNNVEGIPMSPYWEIASVQEAYNPVFEEYAMGKISKKEAGEKVISQVEAAIAEIKK